jgi:hypothetical protein
MGGAESTSVAVADAPGSDVPRDADSPGARLRAAEAEFAGGDAARALEIARALCEREPEIAAAHEVRARALEALGRLPDALEALLLAQRLDAGRTPRLLDTEGRLRKALGDRDGAARAWGRLLEAAPRDTGALEALYALGPAGAAALDRRARSLKPIRVASVESHLWLDGDGRHPMGRPGDPDRHPYLGKAPFNVGDQFVARALARVLRIEAFDTIGVNAYASDFDRINAECSVFFVRGSCFLRPGFFKGGVGQFFRRIKIPILFVGAGVQFALDEEQRLEPEDVDALKYIHDSCASTSVRGHRSVELLAKYGIRNVRATGCPTIVWSLERETRVRRPSLDRVGWTVTDLGWSPAIDDAQVAHVRRLFAAARRLHLVGQGGEIELQRWVAYRDFLHHGIRDDVSTGNDLFASSFRPSDPVALRANLAHYYRHWPAPLLGALERDAFFAPSVHEYFRFLRELSLVVGTRLHGNMMALVQGVPAAFCVHDARLQEMVEFMRVPHFRLGDDVDFAAAAWDWSDWERGYPGIHDGFVRYFEENRLPHRLLPPPPAAG